MTQGPGTLRPTSTAPLTRTIALMLVALGVALLGGLALWRDPPPDAPLATAAPAAPPAPAPVEREAPAAAPAPVDDGAIQVRVAPKLRYARGRPKLPPGPLAGWIADHRARAERGDADAAHALAIALQTCVPLDPRFAKDRELLYASQIRMGRDEAERARIAEQLAADDRARTEFCAGVPPPTRREAFAKLELAAELGNLESINDYVNMPPHAVIGWHGAEPTPAQREEHAVLSRRQHEIAQDAQARGSEAAIYWLAWQAHSGSRPDGTEDDAARDPVAAYAGFIAYRMLRAATQRGIDHATEQGIAALERELRPEQIDAAMYRAVALVGGPECCLVY